MSEREWQPIRTAPSDIEVETAIIDADGQRNTQTLVKFGSAWCFPDYSMRVYYEPTHWRPLTVSP